MSAAVATLAVIGGTGMDRWPSLKPERELTLDTDYGAPSAPLLLGRVQGVPVLFLARHGRAHELAPHRINYRANLKALANCGVHTVIAISAVGGIARWLAPGSLCVPSDLVDYTWGRAHSFYSGGGAQAPDRGLRHIEFTEPYAARVRRELLRAASTRDMDVTDGGVMGVTQGPRLETAAEIRRLQRDGCDMVGMTGMPEAALAAELGMEYACLALSVNWAAGLADGPIHDQIDTVLARCMARADAILAAALPALRAQDARRDGD
ncbi:MAG TPA: S-methyl-5'-thioinosine phosphorylase [Nevskiaceae bacterium]